MSYPDWEAEVSSGFEGANYLYDECNPKRRRTGELSNQRSKGAIFRLTADLFIAVLKLYKLEESDIDAGVQIMNIVDSVFTQMMIKAQEPTHLLMTDKQYESTAADSEAQNVDVVIKLDEKTYSVKRDAIIVTMNKVLSEGGFKLENGQEWMEEICPVLNNLKGFNLRFRELCSGRFYLNINNDPKKRVNMARVFGVQRKHHSLLEGITYSPARKSELVSSLGPLTVLTGLSRTSCGNYKDKLKTAAKRHFASLPVPDSLISIISLGYSLAQFRPLFTIVADFLMLANPRVETTMFPPPNAFAMVCKTGSPLSLAVLDKFTSSYPGGWCRLYKHMTAVPLQMRSSDCTKEMLQQLIYHAMLGSHREDFGELAVITGVEQWHQRSDFNFKERTKTGKLLQVELIKPKLFAIAQRNTSKPSMRQVSCMSIFGGHRVRNFDGLSTIYPYLNRVGQTEPKTLDELLELYRREVEKLEKDGWRMEKYGSVEWITYADVDKDNPRASYVSTREAKTGRYWHGSVGQEF